MADGGSDATFDVSLEVRPVGLTEGLDQSIAAVEGLTGATRAYGEENRRTRTASDDLANAERRRIQTAADLIRSYQQQIQVLEQYRAAAGTAATLQGASQALKIASSGTDPYSEQGKAIADLMAKETSLQASIRQTAEAQAAADRVTANVEGLRQRTVEMEGAVQAARQGEAAERAYAAALEVTRAIAATGAAPGSPGAAAAEAEAVAQERLRAELDAIAAARELDAEAAAQEATAQQRLASVLSSLRSSASQTQEMVAAERQGAQAVTLLNQQLQLRNALLQAGVAEIGAQGELVITSEAGVAAITAEVAALQREAAALLEVRAANAAAAASALWNLLTTALEQVGQALKYIVVYGALFALGAKIKEAVESAFQFEASLTRLRTLVDTTAAEVDKIRVAIVGVSLATGQSADENAKAMFAIESSGLRGEAALRALQASAEGAAIGLGDQTTVARASVAAMTAYGAGNLSAKDALDVLIATAREGNTTVDDLAGSFGRVTGLAASVGVKFGDLGGAVAAFTRVGVSAQEAVTGLRGVLSALDLKEAKTAEAALKSVGLSVAALRTEIKEKGLAQALVDLVSRFDGNNDALAKVIPNIRALAEVMSNAKSQAGEYIAIQDRVNAAIGHATDEAFALEQRDPSFVWKQMTAALAQVGRAIGEDVLPQIVRLAEDIKTLVANGELAGWAHGIAVAIGVMIEVLRAVGFLLGNLPFLLAAVVLWMVASGAALTAWGDAVAFVQLRLEALAVAIVTNPIGAMAVAFLAVAAAINSVVLAQGRLDQAWLDENAKINQDRVALQDLEKQFYRVIDAKGKYFGMKVEGPAAIAASGQFDTSHLELRTDVGFLKDLDDINRKYQEAIASANGDKTALDAAKLAHDRETSALQANTQAQVDNMKAAAARMAVMAKSAGVELDAARKIQEDAERAAAGHGATMAAVDDSMAGILHGGTKQVADPTFAAAQQAAQNVAALKNEVAKYSAEAKAGTEMTAKLQGALDVSRVKHEQTAAATEKGSKALANATREIEKQIEAEKLAARSAGVLAAAQLQGGEAVRQATIAAAAAKVIEEDAQRLVKAGVPLSQARQQVEAKWGDQIRANAQALSDANQQSGLNQQTYASQLETDRQRLAGYAKIQDAMNQTGTASAKLAAVLAIEQTAEKAGIDLADPQVKALKDQALARIDLQTLADAAAVSVQDQLVQNQALLDQEAAYQDALARTTDASREAALQKKVLADLKTHNLVLGTKEADVEEAIVRAEQLDLDRKKALTVQTLAQNAALDILNKEQAKYADLAAVRQSNETVGTAITQVLSQYGLLSRATDELSLKERARAEFAAEFGLRSLAEITAELRGRDEELRKLAELAAAYEIHKIKVDDFLSGLATAFDIMSTGFGGASTAMGKLAADMGKLVVAIQAVADAQGRANKVLAAASVVSAIGSALASLNVGGSGKTGGPQALGGRLDSNYAGIGSIVGIIVGAIVGYYTAGIGTAAGAAIGTALGGVLGAMISKAGDSASAQLTAGGNVIVGETSKQLDGAVSDALHKIFQGLQAVFASLGLLFQGAPLIDIKVRDNIVRVIVGNVVRTFSTMQDAISFAIAEALKQTATGGHLPPEVIAALKNTTATDMQSLQSDIDFAFSIANVGVPKVVQAIDKSVSDFYVAMQRAVSLGIDTGKVVQMFAQQIQAQKDSILQTPGKSPAEQMRADAAAFNQKMDLLDAQEKADLADLAIKRADLEIKLQLLKLSSNLTKDQLQQIKDTEAALASIDTAMAAAQAVIDGIVHISDQELADALARLGKGGKGAGSGAVDSLQQLMDAVAKLVHQSGMSDFQKQLDDIQEKWKTATAAVHLHSNALEEATRVHAAAIKAANGNAAAIKAANDAYERTIAHIHKTQEALDAANRARQQEIDLLKKDLDARVKTFISVGAPGGDLANQLAAVSATAQGLIADSRALYHAGGLTLQQLREQVKAIQAASVAQREAIKSTFLQSVSDFMGGKGATGLLGTLKGISDQAKGLTDGLAALGAAGLLTAEQVAVLTQQVVDSGRAQQEAAVTKSADSLLSDLYGYLGMDKEAAQLKFDLTVLELQARREELAIAMQTLHYTQAQMDAILGPIDILIGKVIAAGPSIFASGASSAGGGGGNVLPFVSPTGALSVPDAQALLAQYQQSSQAALTLNEQLNKVASDFSKIRAVLGNTLEVQTAYAAAVRSLLDKYLQPIKDFLGTLTTGSLSPLTAVQKFHAGQDAFMAAAQAIQGGDLSQLSQIPALAQQLLQEAQAVLPVGSEAYRQIFADVNRILNNILAQYGAAGAGAPPAAGAAPAPPLALVPGSGSPNTVQLPRGAYQGAVGGSAPVNLQPVVEELQQGNAEQITELKKITKNTDATRVSVDRVADRLDRRWSAFRQAS